jgi:hypothetical protein
MTVPNPPVPEEESAESLILSRERERKRVLGNSFFEVNCALLKQLAEKKMVRRKVSYLRAFALVSLSLCVCVCVTSFFVSL